MQEDLHHSKLKADSLKFLWLHPVETHTMNHPLVNKVMVRSLISRLRVVPDCHHCILHCLEIMAIIPDSFPIVNLKLVYGGLG